MLIEAVAQASATAGWPLRLTDLPLGLHRPHQAPKYSFNRDLLVPSNCSPRRLGLLFVSRAADSTPPVSTSTTSSGKTIAPEEGFSLFKTSFGIIGLAVGGALLSYGFGAYFTILPGSEWSALMLTYGFPLAVIGMALKYAELKPVPCITYSDAQSLREICATPTLKQSSGISRRSGPILKMIREEVTEDKKYCLVLVFEAKALQLSDFEQRQAKFASFFAPGITAEIGKGEANDLYEVRLISQTTLQ